MKKNSMCKFLINIFIVFIVFFLNSQVIAKENNKISFVSLSPALTETIYALNAQDMLKGVSSACTYPPEAKNKKIIGDNFFINTEEILMINPNYILALDSSKFMLEKFKKLGITPLCFSYKNINEIYNNILEIGRLVNKEENANKLIADLKNNIFQSNKKHNHKILYLVQTYPMITIGSKSFITDIINKSGNISVTSNINGYYPVISEEYAINAKPDVIILSFYADYKRLKKLFPNTKIIFMTTEENDIINRPGVRIDKSVEFFSKF